MPENIFLPMLSRRVAALLSVLLVASAIAPASADDYTLAPGDEVRLQVAGIEQFSATAQIANDGFVALPRFGRVDTQGKTVEEVLAILQDRVGSITFRVFDSSGLASVREITANDIGLQVARYRDVPVLGSVAKPGLIPFSPGMTVRAAIAAAGGILRMNAAVDGVDASTTALRLGEIRRLINARAEKLAEIWRIEKSLGEPRPAPSVAELGIDAKDADELLALQTRILSAADEDQDKSLELLDNIDQLSVERMKSLEEQLKLQAQTLDIDSSELARIKALLDRGLVVSDRVHELSRMQYLSQAQLLQTQGELERLRIQRKQAEDDRRKVESDRRAKDLAALADARRDLSDLNSQLSGRQMSLALASPATTDTLSPLVVEAVVHRGTGAGAGEMRLDLDALVQPGDVIEIILRVAAAPETGRPQTETPAPDVRSEVTQ